jgi:hypothetical protein
MNRVPVAVVERVKRITLKIAKHLLSGFFLRLSRDSAATGSSAVVSTTIDSC